MNLDKFTIVSYDQIAGFDRQAGMLALVMDEINDFTLSQEEEKNDITGKGGRVIGSQKKNKKVTGKVLMVSFLVVLMLLNKELISKIVIKL